MASSSFPEPSPRRDHYSAAIGGQLYVFGGRTRDFHNEKNKLATSVEIFDQCKEKWQKLSATGNHPSGLYCGACTTIGNQLYVYGGYDGSSHQNSLHQLDIDSLQWSQLPSGLTKKTGCRMVSYKDQLVLFGGHGSNVGDTNDLHCYKGENCRC